MSARLPSLPRREALPLALLLLALASVFVFGGDRSQFYRPSQHDAISLKTLTLAANLSPEQGFAGFTRQKIGKDGEPEYVAYNRFPIGSYALVRLAILPVGDDFRGQILAARLLMLACFAAAAVLAYLALARLLGRRWIALAATLLACSAYYPLYANDMISAEGSTNLFGVMLTFHGMAVFAQEGRFRQLLLKTAVAIALGWHVVGLIGPFVLLGLGGELLRARPGNGSELLRAIAAAARRRHVRYGAFSVLVCALVLGFNFAGEYRILGGEVAPRDLPSFQSMLGRSGSGLPGWPEFLRGQLGGIGGMAIPFALVDRLSLDLAQPYTGIWPPPSSAPRFAALGAAVLAACFAGLRWLPQRTLFASLLLAGWCWAAAFRGSAPYQQFEAMFHVGYPLVLWSLVLLGLRRALPPGRAPRAIPALALAALAAFALSAALMARTGHDAAAAQRQRETAADFSAIRPLAQGRSVLADLIDDALTHRKSMRNYYLTGSYLQIEPIGSAEEWRAVPAYDFAVLPAGLGGSLTPDNRRFFLYRLADLPAVRAAATARAPAAHAYFDVHLDGRSLVYARDSCTGADRAARFFVHLFPADARDLDAGRAPRAFNDLTFAFGERGAYFDGSCLAAFPLPDYPVLGVRTGQYDQGGKVWTAEFPLDADAWRDRRGALAAREPALRSAFAVHLEGSTLTYVREQCSAADTEARFFVRVIAADPGDLPPDRRPYGFEPLSFAFADRGLRHGGTCIAAFELPDYPATGVRTGQYDSAGEVWAGEFPLDPAAWLARRDGLAAREPALRAAFAVHLDGRTLTYVRDGCSEADAEPRFFVHVVAADPDDLPPDRRPYGSESLSFAFADRGLRHGGTCMAAFELPDYPVGGVRTGQYDGAGEVWAGAFPLDPAAWRARFESLAAREPALRAKFAVHLDGRTLTYVRDGCSEADVGPRFFVHVVAADPDDLPADRRPYGSERPTFSFADRGLRHGGTCMAAFELPDYPVADVRTGQYDSAGEVWAGEFAIPAE